MAFIPDSPVGFPTEQRVAYSIWMGRPEQRDANGLAGIALGGCWPVGREPLIATVPRDTRSYGWKQSPLFRHRAASTLIAIEIEMVSGRRRAARGRMVTLL